MIFLILAGIIGLLLLLNYIRTIKHSMKLQNKVIAEQKSLIEKERIAHKQTKAQLDVYINSYNQAVEHIHQINKPKVNVSDKAREYDMDEILNEISTNGINNISKDKLEYLKGIGKK